MPNAAMWAIARVTEAALAVGVPKGAAIAIGKIVVSAAIDAATAAGVNAITNAGRQRAEPPPTDFRATTDAGIPVAYGRCPARAVVSFAK